MKRISIFLFLLAISAIMFTACDNGSSDAEYDFGVIQESSSSN